jgi:hypothetical protein
MQPESPFRLCVVSIECKYEEALRQALPRIAFAGIMKNKLQPRLEVSKI